MKNWDKGAYKVGEGRSKRGLQWLNRDLRPDPLSRTINAETKSGVYYAHLILIHERNLKPLMGKGRRNRNGWGLGR